MQMPPNDVLAVARYHLVLISGSRGMVKPGSEALAVILRDRAARQYRIPGRTISRWARCSARRSSRRERQLIERAGPIIRLSLPAYRQVLVPGREPAPAGPIRQQREHARVSDGAGQV